MQHNASLWAGLYVDTSFCHKNLICNETLVVSTGTNQGYRVRVYGSVTEVHGSTTLASVSRIDIIEVVELPVPLNITTAIGGNCSKSRNSEPYEGVLVVLEKQSTILKDRGYEKHIQINDGSGPLTLSTELTPYTMDTIRVVLNTYTLEGVVFTKVRGVFSTNSNATVSHGLFRRNLLGTEEDDTIQVMPTTLSDLEGFTLQPTAVPTPVPSPNPTISFLPTPEPTASPMTPPTPAWYVNGCWPYTMLT